MNRNTARYVWDQAAGLPQMLSDGSTLYVPGVGQWNGTSWAYELRDGLGSVRQLSDASGNVVQSYTYAPFGELLAAQGTRSSALQYTGEQKDVDTGLVYLRARWYDSATGRFTTRDPFPGFAALPQTLHPYGYALNNPINLTDPSGEYVESPWDLLMLGLDILLAIFDKINPALDECTREQLLSLDRIAIGIDIAALLLPGAPGGEGFAGNLAGRGALLLARSSAGGLRIIRVSVQAGVQAGVHASAMTKGGGRGTRGGSVRGSSGGSGSASSGSELSRVSRKGVTHSGKFPTKSPHEYLYRVDSSGKITAFARYDSSGEVIYRVDLQGRSHRGVPTPHLQPAIWDSHPVTGSRYFRGWGDAVRYTP
jgi:RHS repeat-associated protein